MRQKLGFGNWMDAEQGFGAACQPLRVYAAFHALGCHSLCQRLGNSAVMRPQGVRQNATQHVNQPTANLQDAPQAACTRQRAKWPRLPRRCGTRWASKRYFGYSTDGRSAIPTRLLCRLCRHLPGSGSAVGIVQQCNEIDSSCYISNSVHVYLGACILNCTLLGA